MLSFGAVGKFGSFGFAKGLLACRAKPNVPNVGWFKNELKKNCGGKNRKYKRVNLSDWQPQKKVRLNCRYIMFVHCVNFVWSSVFLRLPLTVSGLAKVAIFTTNVDAENQTLINHKCVCGALNRHFCQTRVMRKLKKQEKTMPQRFTN